MLQRIVNGFTEIVEDALEESFKVLAPNLYGVGVLEGLMFLYFVYKVYQVHFKDSGTYEDLKHTFIVLFVVGFLLNNQGAQLLNMVAFLNDFVNSLASVPLPGSENGGTFSAIEEIITKIQLTTTGVGNWYTDWFYQAVGMGVIVVLCLVFGLFLIKNSFTLTILWLLSPLILLSVLIPGVSLLTSWIRQIITTALTLFIGALLMSFMLQMMEALIKGPTEPSYSALLYLIMTSLVFSVLFQQLTSQLASSLGGGASFDGGFGTQLKNGFVESKSLAMNSFSNLYSGSKLMNQSFNNSKNLLKPLQRD